MPEEIIDFIKTQDKLPIEFKQKWVSALRSGNYIQGKGVLYASEDNTYCCLGVAAAVCGVSEFNMIEKGVIPSYLDVRSTFINVPTELRKNRALQSSLYKLNDNYRLTFSQIAEIIEEYL